MVAAHLKKLGYRSFRFNTDDFPAKYKVSWNFTNADNRFTLSFGKKIIDSDQISAVWIRKVLFHSEDESVAEDYRKFVKDENDEITRSFLLRLSQWPILDAFDHIEKAESKPLQQHFAISCKLRIPNAILSNNMPEIKKFMGDKKKKYITKLFRPVSWSMNGDEGFFYTTIISKKDMAAADLSVHPVLIQEFIPKLYELRIIFIGGVFFTGKIVVDEFEEDWRRPGKVKSWQQYTLPQEVEKKLNRLMKKLQLDFGAIDMIRGTDGQYYFLEVNPIGEWGMLEKYLGLPISAAIAAHLINISENE